MTPDRHVAQFAREGGELVVGGVPVGRLAERVGSTPFFAYDRDRITERVATLRSALPDDLHLGYAVKANPMPAVVQHLSALVDHLDVASVGEMAVALDTGTPAGHVTFAGPGKTDAELRRAVAAGVLVEAESEGEVERMVHVGEDLGITPRAAIRVNPDFAVKGSGMRMGGGPQQFGVDAEAVPRLMARMAALGLPLEGFHVFAGSQNLHADILVQAQQHTVDLVLELAKSAVEPIGYVNLGGGLGIPYFEKDEPVDVERVGDNLARLMAERIRPVLGEVRVGIELGRYLVGEAGVYVTRVVDRKVSRGQTYLVVDGGMHHQLAASGNFGQVIRRNYPLAVADRLDATDVEEATVVGCLCTPSRPAGRPDAAAAGGRGRPRRGVPGRGLWPHREPDGLPGAPGPGRSARVTTDSKGERSMQTTQATLDEVIAVPRDDTRHRGPGRVVDRVDPALRRPARARLPRRRGASGRPGDALRHRDRGRGLHRRAVRDRGHPGRVRGRQDGVGGRNTLLRGLQAPDL